MALDRESFLKAATLNRREVKLADGSSVWVREMTAAEVSEFVRIQKKDGDIITHAILSTLCDEDGNKLLQKTDAEAVAALPAGMANTILNAGLEVSGLTESPKA